MITLGIIGVVAALTIPTLISKFEEKALVSQFKKTYSMLNQALQLANYENGVEFKCYTKLRNFGNDNYYEYSECTEFWDVYFNELKFLKYDTLNSLPYKTKAEVLAEGGGVTNNACSFSLVANTRKYYLQDGAVIYVNPLHNSHITLFMIVDINGDKGPNKWGYDVFYLTPTKRKSGSIRINEGVCTIWEKGGKRAFNILNGTDDVSDKWFFD